MRCKILLSESELSVIDNIVNEKGMQSFIQKFFKCFFNIQLVGDWAVITVI